MSLNYLEIYLDLFPYFRGKKYTKVFNKIRWVASNIAQYPDNHTGVFKML